MKRTNCSTHYFDM